MKNILYLLLLISSFGYAQTMKRTDKVFNKIRYIEYWPEIPKDSIKGIVLYQHGLGEVGYNLNVITRNEIPRLIEHGKFYPYIFICPQLDKGTSYPVSFELECIKLIQSYNVTPRHATGLSLGAQGTVQAVVQAYKLTGQSGFFKTACTVSGKTSLRDSAAFAGTKWIIFHGTYDNIFNIRADKNLCLYMDAKKIPEWHEWINAGHACWSFAYCDDKYFKWLNDQK